VATGWCRLGGVSTLCETPGVDFAPQSD